LGDFGAWTRAWLGLGPDLRWLGLIMMARIPVTQPGLKLRLSISSDTEPDPTAAVPVPLSSWPAFRGFGSESVFSY
jgi:hypothetical protein